MNKRKIVFNIYEDLPHGRGKKEITANLLARVAEDIPITGAIRYTLADGSKLMASKHDYVKNETYDVYWD